MRHKNTRQTRPRQITLHHTKPLHVECSQTGVVEPPGHDPEGVTHEHLVDPVAAGQIGRGELNVVLGVVEEIPSMSFFTSSIR